MPHQSTFSKTSTVVGTFHRRDRSLFNIFSSTLTSFHRLSSFRPSLSGDNRAGERERERGEEREARARHGVGAATPRSSCLGSLACHGHGRYPSLGTEIAGSSPSAALLCFVFYDAFAAPASGTLVSSFASLVLIRVPSRERGLTGEIVTPLARGGGHGFFEILL
jgi:hypothetical protein